ncbi:MAG: cupin domain-containing protein [Bacteroidetes bacterium HGW-Bacteroidetes-12]|nr:MAG: cupin domain-containing protein [Bacteroidetes bacterium HGW-Bacteroidetes-12]
MKILIFILFLFCMKIGVAQGVLNLDTLQPKQSYENILVEPIYENENNSYYVIWIKKEVKSHKHLTHTETITVIEGEGIMTVGKNSFTIKKGDFFEIPKNTFHALKVISEIPMKVLSIQMPKFDGEDRIFEY